MQHSISSQIEWLLERVTLGKVSQSFLLFTSHFHPAMPGDSQDFIRRIIIQVLPSFYTFLIFLESNQETHYHRLNTRRLGLNLIPKVVMTKTFLFSPTVAHAC